MISIFLNLLKRLSYMWYIPENVPYALEKYVYSAALGWNDLRISIKSIWSSVLFKAAISLLIFCLEDLPIEINVLKSLIMTLFQLISPFYVHQYLLHVFSCFYVGCINVYWGYILLLLDCSLYHFVMSLFVSYYNLGFKVYFVGYKYCYPSFFPLSIYMKFLFHPFTFSLCVSFNLRWIS